MVNSTMPMRYLSYPSFLISIYELGFLSFHSLPLFLPSCRTADRQPFCLLIYLLSLQQPQPLLTSRDDDNDDNDDEDKDKDILPFAPHTTTPAAGVVAAVAATIPPASAGPTSTLASQPNPAPAPSPTSSRHSQTPSHRHPLIPILRSRTSPTMSQDPPPPSSKPA